MNKDLALRWRPNVFSDVVEQDSTKAILQNQITQGDIKSAILLCGASGCGKTTLARIYANEINKGQGHPIEIDAASNNGVDNIRAIIEDCKLRSLDCEYKVYIIDEVHMLSQGAFNALLKTLEEPPEKVVFILCTTEPKKIPLTILSRVQRFDYKRISFQGILNRLLYILQKENEDKLEDQIIYEQDAIEFIAKLADGGMRRGIKMLEQCLSYTNNINYELVCSTLGVISYDKMFELVNLILDKNPAGVINFIDKIYLDGVDLKQFISDYTEFLLDLNKFQLLSDFSKINIPIFYQDNLKEIMNRMLDLKSILFDTNEISNNIKREDKPKPLVTLGLMKQCK